MPWFIFVIVGSMLLGDVAFWTWADRKLRRMRGVGARRASRALLAGWTAAALAYMTWFMLFPREARHSQPWLPTGVVAAMYIWHLLVLPATLLYILFESLAGGFARAVRRRRQSRSATIDAPADLGLRGGDEALAATFTRRQALLAAATVAVPPLLTGVGVTVGMRQLPHFRVRRIELALRSLPAELDGVTIAHVTDLHIGRFTREHMLPAIADATNALKADLVLLTGDLIDLSLADLPAGIDFVRKLDPRSGLFMCEGNHDLIENPYAFESRVRQAGLPLLLDEARELTLRGRTVQILGATWGRGDSAHVGAVSRMLPLRRPDAFQILLAHHPHAFDPAAAVGIPLTLAGHTHGGQLMLNERLGAGPVMFRYWSGAYRHGDAALVVSNGVGNWFPLRINAPAEIVHITLKSAAWTV